MMEVFGGERTALRIALVYQVNGDRRRVRRVPALVRALTTRGHSVTLHDSLTFRFPEDAPDAELLCICGGDGTARLVLDAQDDLFGLPPLAIYPTGTINLLARELGYPASPDAFARRIEDIAEARSCRVATMGDRLFLACASIGIDALAVARVSLSLKAAIGRFAYVAALAQLLWRWPRQRLRVLADGEEIGAEALFLLRGSHYAGPWTLDPEAGLMSDRLHVLALPRARRRDVLSLAFYAFNGAKRLRKEWRLFAASHVHVSADRPLPVQADGDIVAATPVDIRMGNQSVRWV